MNNSKSFCIGLKVKMESGECGIIKKIFQEFVYLDYGNKIARRRKSEIECLCNDAREETQGKSQAKDSKVRDQIRDFEKSVSLLQQENLFTGYLEPEEDDPTKEEYSSKQEEFEEYCAYHNIRFKHEAEIDQMFYEEYLMKIVDKNVEQRNPYNDLLKDYNEYWRDYWKYTGEFDD